MEQLLINNSASMKTVVETYIIEETQELIYDNEKLDQWNNLVAELGLTGQTKIQAKDKSPIPFLHMKSTLVNVFLQLCPRREGIAGRVPARIAVGDGVRLDLRRRQIGADGVVARSVVGTDDAV